MSYPSIGASAGASYNYSYDSMYRLSGMTDSSNNTIVSNVSYNAANQLLTINYPTGDETRVYNTLGQLTNLYVQLPPYFFTYAVNLTYTYPTGTNNGKVSSMYNAISGETATYAYDSLNRLLTASGSISGTTTWGQQYGFDRFGNLLSKTITAGSPPSLSQAVNTANNQIVGQSYDNNGNPYAAYNGGQTYSLRYDGENRMISATTEAGTYVDYGYDAQNRRIWSWPGAVDGVGNTTNYTVNVYSPSGQKLGAYLFTPSAMGYEGQIIPIMVVTLSSSDQYFGGRRLAPMDQLGSVVNSSQAYFLWGETKGTSNPQDTWNFATYWQDSNTGLDYANNRYYSNGYGRFMTDDPSAQNWDPSNPQSWNTYAYANGDPINNNDPSGLDVDVPITDGGDPNSCLNQSLIPWMDKNGFTVGNNLGNLFNSPTGVLGLTLYYEDTGGSTTLYSDFAQVMINRYELSRQNPTLYSQLGLPDPGAPPTIIIQGSSNAWTDGDLISGDYNNLINVLNGSVVGASSAVNAFACNQLISALSIGSQAANYLDNPATHTFVSNVSTNTYWFYNSGADPVNHSFWITKSQNVQGSTKVWTFEALVGPRRPPPRRHRRPRGRQ